MIPWNIWPRMFPFALIAAGTWLLTQWLCHRAFRLQEHADVTTGWFGFTQAQSRVTTICWFAWMIGVLLLDPWQSLALDLHWPPLARSVFHNAFTILPPALIVAVCDLMTYPVVQRVRGLDLPKQRFIVDAFLGRLWLAVPAALMWTGFRARPTGKNEANVSTLFMAAGVVAFMLFQVFWLRRRLPKPSLRMP